MLFDAPLIRGLSVREELIDAVEEQALLARSAGIELSPFRFQGFTGKRLTRSFGYHYDFDTARFATTEPIPDWLLPLRARAGEFASLAPDDLVQALVIRYDPGAGIGWHRDRPLFDQVVGVSLGAPALLNFRQRTANRFSTGQGAARPALGLSSLRRRTDRLGTRHRQPRCARLS